MSGRNKKKQTTRAAAPRIGSATEGPGPIAAAAFCAALALPNLVFSGTTFFETLHLAKWVATFVPFAALGVFEGWRLARRGPDGSRLRLDLFGAGWLGLLLLCALQPLWADVRSLTTLVREWFFPACLLLVYLLSLFMARGRVLRAAMLGSALCAAASVLLAEMQIRGATGLFPGAFYTTARDYLANTGQRNMLALWLAIGGLNSAHLLLSDGGRRVRAAAGALFAVNAYGLFSTNSLSGFAAFSTGLALMLLFRLRVASRGARRATGVFLLVAAAGSAALLLSPAGERFTPLRHKISRYATAAVEARDMKPWTILGERGTIWATSWAMIGERPMRGVGLGQFKWNYLQAQREAQRRWPHLEWGYTSWAHNEFLQWLAETGAPGAAVLLILWLWWLWTTLRALFRGTPLSREAVWGCAMVALFTMDAMWTRPFHRIENAVWLAVAFAVANREVLRGMGRDPSAMNPPRDDRIVDPPRDDRIVDSPRDDGMVNPPRDDRDVVVPNGATRRRDPSPSSRPPTGREDLSLSSRRPTGREDLSLSSRRPTGRRDPGVDDRAGRPRAIACRLFGGAVCSLSLAGLIYLADGVRGDRALRLALQASDPIERGNLLRKAYGCPMVRDTAERQLAYYYVQLGELQQDPEMIAHGVNSVIDVFEKQPNMDDLVVLRKWAEILRHEELARYVYRYSDIPDNLPEVGGGGM